MNSSIQFTKEGLTKIKAELEDLVKNKQPKAIERLGVARAMGDLSENSEYVAAKEDRANIAGRIQELEEIIKRAVVNDSTPGNNVIGIGSSVSVVIDGGTDNFKIVGEFEADPITKKISHTSPLGKALLNKKIGELVEVEVPAGKKIYKIISIT